MKRITDPTFKYVPASKTDVGATIRREIKRLAKLKELTEKYPSQRNEVVPILRKGGAK